MSKVEQLVDEALEEDGYSRMHPTIGQWIGQGLIDDFGDAVIPRRLFDRDMIYKDKYYLDDIRKIQKTLKDMESELLKRQSMYDKLIKQEKK